MRAITKIKKKDKTGQESREINPTDMETGYDGRQGGRKEQVSYESEFNSDTLATQRP